MRPAVLIADEDEPRRSMVNELLRRHRYCVLEAGDRADVRRCLDLGAADLAIVRPRDGEGQAGIRLAEEIRREEPHLPLILIVAQSTEELVIAALRARVTDYLRHPLSCADLIAAVERGLADRAAVPLARTEPASDLVDGEWMIGESRAIHLIRARLAKVAPRDSSVLITGETGTGKELVAQLIHRNSERRHRPLVCVNCAAIPDGLFESEIFGHERGAFTGAIATHEGQVKLADGGTVFFDEIGDLSASAQAKLLRVIETKEVHRLGGRKAIPIDVRVVAATNRDLAVLMADGKFRSDLYFRLNVIRIHLPALRDRREDIAPLLGHYIQDMNRRFGVAITGVTNEALEALVQHDWPGNIRELRNLVEALAVELPSARIAYADLPRTIRRRSGDRSSPGPTAEAASERDRVLSALSETDWNKCRAAERLHWSRVTLYRKIAKYRITRGGQTQPRTSPADHPSSV